MYAALFGCVIEIIFFNCNKTYRVIIRREEIELYTFNYKSNIKNSITNLL